VYVKKLIPYFLFFLLFEHEFIRCIDFTCIAASNTASNDVTNYVTHRIFNTDFLYSCAHFWSKLMKNLALMAGFNTI